MSQGIWIFAEQHDGELRKVTLELLSEGRKLADNTNQELAAVLLGENVEELSKTLAEYGADKIYLAECSCLKQYNTGLFTDIVSDLVKKYEPSAFLWGNTSLARDLAPRVAERVETGLLSDCTAVEVSGDNLIFERPIYAGKAMIKASVETAPAMATIRPNIFEIVKGASKQSLEIIKE